MAETSPAAPDDPKSNISEEELDDFLAGAGTVSKDELPDPAQILGEELDVPTVNSDDVRTTLNKLQAQAVTPPPAVESAGSAALTETVPAAIETDVTVPEASSTTAPPAPARKFSLRRLGRKLFGK